VPSADFGVVTAMWVLLCWDRGLVSCGPGRWRAGPVRIAVILELVLEQIEHAASRSLAGMREREPASEIPHRWRVAKHGLRDPARRCSADLTSGRSRASVNIHGSHVRRTTPLPRRTSILRSQRLPGVVAADIERRARGRHCKWFDRAFLGAKGGPIELPATVGSGRSSDLDSAVSRG
jgi:hypothetical protein